MNNSENSKKIDQKIEELMSLDLFGESYFTNLEKKKWNRAYDIAYLRGQINGLRISQAILEGKCCSNNDNLPLKSSVFGEVPELSLRKRLQLLVSGRVFLCYVQPPGYSGPVPVYVVKCAKHGLYLDNPHGHREYFQCRDCLAEAKLEAS